jgi:5-formyltetrahydrofolate cyclo-ligase
MPGRRARPGHPAGAMLSKQELRKNARARRAELSRALPDFAEWIVKFADEIEVPPSSTLGFYWPVRDEADPRLLAEALAARGHALALPRIAAKDAALVFHRWTQSDATLVNGFGITEPLEDAEAVAPCVLFVPLLAFDAEGYRLGYGAGYYDRTLESLKAEGRALAIGVAYSGQEVRELPRRVYDQRLDAVLTERGLQVFHHT